MEDYFTIHKFIQYYKLYNLSHLNIIYNLMYILYKSKMINPNKNPLDKHKMEVLRYLEKTDMFHNHIFGNKLNKLSHTLHIRLVKFRINHQDMRKEEVIFKNLNNLNKKKNLSRYYKYPCILNSLIVVLIHHEIHPHKNNLEALI
jgi:hypothetical protein